MLPPEHAAEFLRCLIDLDVRQIRRLWQHIAPGMSQPKNDAEALYTMHLARTTMKTGIPKHLVEYSKRWLNERRTMSIVENAVGISVNAPAHRAKQAGNMREAMQDSVFDSLRAGIDLDLEAVEVRRRMNIAARKA